jgi:hypothetical protein
MSFEPPLDDSTNKKTTAKPSPGSWRRPKKKLAAPRRAKGNWSELPHRERESVENEHDPDKTVNTPN